jgi:preprotein translocase subunit YajC
VSKTVIVAVVLFALLWLLLIAPQRRRQRAQQEALKQIDVGDEVLTVGGLYGRVKELGDTEAKLEIADGVEVRIARRAIAGTLPPDEPSEPTDDAAAADEPS